MTIKKSMDCPFLELFEVPAGVNSKTLKVWDPLTVPFSKLLYQGSENFWLRKLATGREVYVATMGEVSQVVFVNEILAQIRGRGIDLDRLGQH